jgi:hypothetical protein
MGAGNCRRWMGDPSIRMWPFFARERACQVKEDGGKASPWACWRDVNRVGLTTFATLPSCVPTATDCRGLHRRLRPLLMPADVVADLCKDGLSNSGRALSQPFNNVVGCDMCKRWPTKKADVSHGFHRHFKLASPRSQIVSMQTGPIRLGCGRYMRLARKSCVMR